MKKDKKPSIRFKEFTEAWEQRKLNELSNIYDGTHQTPNYKDNGIMFLSVENIKDLKSNKYISLEDFKKNFKIYPQKNDILMTRIGDIGTPNIVKDNTPIAYYVSLALIKPFNIQSSFLNVAIQSNYIQNGLRERSLLTAIPMKINKDQIGLVDVLYPKNENEQDKIGKLFENLDNLITLHQSKCNNIQVKNKINIRYNDITWEQRKLGEYGDFTYGHSAPKWSVTSDAKTPCVRYGELYTKFGVKIDKVFSYTNMPKNKLVFSKGNEVLIPRVGEDPYDYNHCTWLSMPNVAIGEMISIYYTKQNPLFTAIMYNATLRNEFAIRVEGGSVTNLYYDKLKDIDVSFPNKEEQEKISTFFYKIDNLITLHQCKLEKLKNLKKSLLNKMFV